VRAGAPAFVRILYVNHTAAVSGAERSLLALLAALPASVEPLVACPRGRLSEAVEQLGVATTEIIETAGSLRVHALHTPRALAEMSFAALQIGRAARRHRAEIVHANSIRAGLELAPARVGPAASIVHVRDCLPPGVLTTATMRLIAATATTVLANSDYTAGTVRNAAPNAQLEVVHPAIDIVEFDPARIDRADARAKLGVAGTRRVLLGVVAQLSPWKGQDTAIEALRLLGEQGVDAHLLLIGSAKFVAGATRFDNEEYVAGLRRLIADAGLGERVSFLGERDDVPQLVRALDVLLLPSHEEPFGRALLEAMALEVPVLATSVGGPAELVRDGRDGYLLPPSVPAAWADGVRRIVEGPEQGHALGEAGRERVVEAFGAEEHAAAMLAVYDRATARR
jgi:glycosyltransferase involved in cell wall biosynthesis